MKDKAICCACSPNSIQPYESNQTIAIVHAGQCILIQQCNQMDGLGVVRDLNKLDLLDQRLTYIAISVYGYVKRVAAID